MSVSSNYKETLKINTIIARRILLMSHEELAEKSGVSKPVINEIEGGGANPSLHTVNRLADAFNIPIALYLSGYDEFLYFSSFKEATILNENDMRRVHTLMVPPKNERGEYVHSLIPMNNRMEAAEIAASAAVKKHLSGIGAAIGCANYGINGAYVGAYLAE